MKSFYACTLIVGLSGGLIADAVDLPKNLPANLTVHVVDEQGNPVPNADAGVTFVRFNYEEGRIDYFKAHGSTDNSGNVLSESLTATGEASFGAKKQGYYNTTGLHY